MAPPFVSTLLIWQFGDRVDGIGPTCNLFALGARVGSADYLDLLYHIPPLLEVTAYALSVVSVD
jgi:hypothetical protein